MIQCAKWIWADMPAGNDSYADFCDSFLWDGGAVTLEISADSNYAVWLNGEPVGSGQYPDFPHYKVYDRLELTHLCRPGMNRLAVTVWYYGEQNMSYYPGNAALRYCVLCGDAVLCYSDTGTLSRQSRTYACGLQRNITTQLGFGYRYDMTREDAWLRTQVEGFKPSILLEQDLPMYLRPVERCTVGAPVASACIGGNGSTHFLLDLGRECSGYLSFFLESEAAQEMTVAYGEHIHDGGVRRLIGSRDFSVQIRLRAGENRYTNPFRRFGLRYLEVFTQEPVKLHAMTVCPVDYPLACTGKAPQDPLRRQIWDVSARTLALCMHDHYEDTPWREQGLYAMDSRNQMLCGYYAFGEQRFPRASLLLMSKDRRADGLLSICVPSGIDLTIPSFSLHYFTAVLEYGRHTGDLSLLRQVYPKLTDLMGAFIRHMEGGCLPTWEGENYWNFYEWSVGLKGHLGMADKRCYDAPQNCLFSMALQALHGIAGLLGEPSDYLALAEQVNRQICCRFLEDGTFRNSEDDSSRSQLVNALAILCGAAEGDTARHIAQQLYLGSPDWTQVTLSMRCFVYDALLKVDKARYTGFILEDIDRRYKRMLDAGATAFWETEAGHSDFAMAGSLCHGWSAMPIYYYGTLL